MKKTYGIFLFLCFLGMFGSILSAEEFYYKFPAGKPLFIKFLSAATFSSTAGTNLPPVRQ